MDLQALFTIDPYSLNKEDKSELLDHHLNDLTQYHYAHCRHYRSILHAIGYDPESRHLCADVPFLPVRLFKIFDLRSAPQESIVKTMTSSGTSGQEVSRIFLDRETSANQTKTLAKIVFSFLGTERSPMLIIDSESVLKDRNLFSARGAGILGFSMFGTKRVYALDENMELDTDRVLEFIKENQGERLFLFGFTFMVYQHLIMELRKRGLQLDLSNAVLIHGGGWKKLASESVTSSEFKRTCRQLCGIQSIHDYYGMVEQTGSIHMECAEGHLHASVFSDIFIRRPHDFSIAPHREQGIIQTLSVLPKSYPGHSLLTEDEGVILGEDDCPCGRLGKYFKVVGRIKGAEIRGCSDTYADKP